MLSPHQSEQSTLARSGRVGILTGGPGVGKTYVAATVLADAVQRYGLAYTRACAPTGKAAVRITEAIQSHRIAVEASTIHRMLWVSRNGHDGDGWGFNYNPTCPLPAKFVLVDEVSMLDTDLAASLFSALEPETEVLLVGDPGQLPPVGHGAVLRDLINAGFPCGKLTEVWRNEGDIVRACRDIHEGRPFKPSPVVDLAAGMNLLHIEVPTPTLAKARLRRLLETTPAVYDRVWDVQVLCALNESGPLSRNELNTGLQNILNPAGKQHKSHQFRTGDKVMCTRNQFMRVVENGERSDTEEFVANGDIGRVVEVGPRKMHVQFELPDRLCYVGGDVLKHDFTLAYAITVHKSQGSQWPVVIYVSDDCRAARFVTCRELLYTAISRAEELAVTIGKKSTIDADCRHEVLSKRKTFLVEKIIANRTSK